MSYQCTRHIFSSKLMEWHAYNTSAESGYTSTQRSVKGMRKNDSFVFVRLRSRFSRLADCLVVHHLPDKHDTHCLKKNKPLLYTVLLIDLIIPLIRRSCYYKLKIKLRFFESRFKIKDLIFFFARFHSF